MPIAHHGLENVERTISLAVALVVGLLNYVGMLVLRRWLGPRPLGPGSVLVVLLIVMVVFLVVNSGLYIGYQ